MVIALTREETLRSERMTNYSSSYDTSSKPAPLDAVLIESPPAPSSSSYKRTTSNVSAVSTSSLPPSIPSGGGGIKKNNGPRKTNICVCVRVRPLEVASAPSSSPRNRVNKLSTPPSSPRGKKKHHNSSSSSLSFRSSGSGGDSLDGSSVTSSGSGSGKAGNSRGRLQPPSTIRTRDNLNKFRGKSTSHLRNSSTSHSENPPAEAATEKAPAWLVTTDNTNTIYQSPSTLPPDPSNNNSNNTNNNTTRKTSYSFDKAYGPNSQTSTLYTQSVQSIVQSSMEGYHGSVFAYGQTSTGKTYTMSGTDAEPGIVPLAVHDCFSFIQNQHHSCSKREYLLRVSYMEIYNECIVDLLSPPEEKTTGGATIPIRIFESRNEGVIVRGLREEIVTSPADVFALLQVGEARRKTGSTNLNKQSSRSHSIFRLIIESRERRKLNYCCSNDGASSVGSSGDVSDTASALNDTSGPVRVSSLSLVDLAGSESVKATGSIGQRQKEGQYINKSLMTLGHVVYKLSELAAKNEEVSSVSPTASSSLHMHIPYRDSKLTRLLQPSLSGNAQICIICTISPSTKNIEESHNTLKFASRAKRIKQSAVVTEVVDDKSLLQNYREEIEDLKRQLKEAKEAAESAATAGKVEVRKPLVVNAEEEDMLVSPATTPSANASVATAPTVSTEQDEDTSVLVAAIKNLEHLILKTSSFQHQQQQQSNQPQPPPHQQGKKKNRSVPSINASDITSSPPTIEVKNVTPTATHKRSKSGSVLSGSFTSSTEKHNGTKIRLMVASSDDEDTSEDTETDASSSANEQDAGILSPVPKKELHTTDFATDDDNDLVKRNKKLNRPLPQSLLETDDDDDDDDDEEEYQNDHNSSLVAELHRIQGLLGSVLEKKTGMPTSVRKVSSSATETPIRRPPSTPMMNNGIKSAKKNGKNMFMTPQRDEEVEQLRSQLHAQELATSMRKADSSFLESQLAQKDSLLKEVSEILESVEKRQVELEHENAKMKMQLIRASKALRKRDVEMASLRKQVEELSSE